MLVTQYFHGIGVADEVGGAFPAEERSAVGAVEEPTLLLPADSSTPAETPARPMAPKVSGSLSPGGTPPRI
jgi:hypothetical protein